jgi:hypothetical protein
VGTEQNITQNTIKGKGFIRSIHLLKGKKKKKKPGERGGLACLLCSQEYPSEA